MKEKFAKLIDVKSIMTLALTIVFCVLAFCGTISGGEFLSIFTMIVGFYFGTQATKKAEEAAAKVQTGAGAGAVDSAAYAQTHPDDVMISRR